MTALFESPLRPLCDGRMEEIARMASDPQYAAGCFFGRETRLAGAVCELLDEITRLKAETLTLTHASPEQPERTKA